MVVPMMEKKKTYLVIGLKTEEPPDLEVELLKMFPFTSLTVNVTTYQ